MGELSFLSKNCFCFCPQQSNYHFGQISPGPKCIKNNQNEINDKLNVLSILLHELHLRGILLRIETMTFYWILNSIRFAIPHQPIRGKLPETLRGEDTKSLSIKYGRNFQKPKQGFRLPHYRFDSVQNLDGFKCVPGVCRSDDLQGPKKQEKKI